jgi:hypothetical protein
MRTTGPCIHATGPCMRIVVHHMRTTGPRIHATVPCMRNTGPRMCFIGLKNVLLVVTYVILIPLCILLVPASYAYCFSLYSCY